MNGFGFIAISLLAFCVFVIISYYNPAFSLGCLVIVRAVAEGAPLLKFIPYSISSQVTSILGVITLIWSIFIIIKNNRNIRYIPFLTPIIVLLVVLFIPALLAGLDGLLEYSRILSIFALYFAVFVVCLNQKGNNKLIPKMLFISSMLPLLVGFYFYFHGVQFVSLTFERMISTFSSPNRYSIYLSQGLMISLALYFDSGKSWKRFIYGLAIIALGVGIILSFSRISWIITVMGLILIAIFHNRRLLIWLLLLPLLANFYPDIIRRLTLNSYNSNTITGRFELWKSALLFFQRSFLFGQGLGFYRSFSFTSFGLPLVPHNTYIQMLVEGGLVGFIPYIIFWAIVLWSTIKNLNSKSIWPKIQFVLLIQILTAMISENLFDDLANLGMFWAFSAFTFALMYHLKNSGEKQVTPNLSTGRYRRSASIKQSIPAERGTTKMY